LALAHRHAILKAWPLCATPLEAQKRYSPPVCVGAKRKEVTGRPAQEHISTSYPERQNLNIRMGNRRFTRLTNAFSKKVENHVHALAIYFMHYNFVRIHQTTRVTPAMAAGVSQTLWSLEDIMRAVGASLHTHPRSCRSAA
jgi:hypothetical protein